MPSQAERSDATKGALVSAARRLFADQGFAGTSVEAILDQAGVSRGALYHHFDGKDDLFLAVFEAVEEDLTSRVVLASAGAKEPLDQLRLGFEAFLDLCLDSEVRRVVLLDGPTVLGWEAWHEIDERYAFGLIKAALDLAVERGAIEEQPTDALAHVLLGAMMQAGFVVAKAADRAAEKKRMAATLGRLLAAL